MEAIVISACVIAYLFLPFAWFRFVLGAFVPLREFHADDKDHLAQAVLTLASVFLLALYAVHHCPVVKDHPFGFSDSEQLRVSDYKIALSALHSDKIFEQKEPLLWDIAYRALLRQSRFLCWYFAFTGVVAVLLGFASKRYGQFSKWAPFRIFADVYLLRHISQWHPLLTSFVFADRKTIVEADVLMTDNTLYTGEVADHFLDKDGNLAGLFLAKPKRFDRRALLRERESWGTNRPATAFWHDIPSAKLYLVGDKIVNLNLRYESPSPNAELIEKYLSRTQPQFKFTVSVTEPGPTAQAQALPDPPRKKHKRL